jgi:hypothetical protein
MNGTIGHDNAPAKSISSSVGAMLERPRRPSAGDVLGGRRRSPGCLDTRGRRFLATFPVFLIPEQELAKMQESPEKHGTFVDFGAICQISRGNSRHSAAHAASEGVTPNLSSGQPAHRACRFLTAFATMFAPAQL